MSLLVRILKSLLNRIESEKQAQLLKHANSEVSGDLIIGRYNNLFLHPQAESLKIGSGVVIREFFSLRIHEDASLIIGENVFINNYCSFTSLKRIVIGENTLFGEGVKIYDHNHEFYQKNNQLTIEREKFTVADVIIGKNCWIASNVTILKGVHIGDNVIIGANNLIFSSVLSNTIVKSTASSTTSYISNKLIDDQDSHT